MRRVHVDPTARRFEATVSLITDSVTELAHREAAQERDPNTPLTPEKRRSFMKLSVTLLACLLSTTAWAADAARTVAPWTLLDQFEQAYTFDNKARVLLIARSMSTAKLVNAALEDQPAGYLEARRVVYVADIEQLPSIAKMVMVPAMRSAKYRIMLDQTGSVAPRYGDDRDSVQWLELENGTITREHRYTDAPALQQALQTLAR